MNVWLSLLGGTGLLGALGWALFLWQRAKVSAAETRASTAVTRANAAEANSVALALSEKNDAVKYEAIIADLKAEIARLEREISTTASTPTAVADRLRGILQTYGACSSPASSSATAAVQAHAPAKPT